MSHRWSTLLAWSLFGLFALLVGFVYVELARGLGSDEWFTIVALGYAFVGALVASRRPEHRLGWLLLTVALLLAYGGAVEVWILDPERPARAWVGWVEAISWNAWMILAAVFLPLTFPTGRLLSPRWRPVAWLGVVALVSGALTSALRPGPMDLVTPIDNPAGVAGAAWWLDLVATASEVLVAVAFVLAGTSLVMRFRRSEGIERQQLKWFALVGLVVVVALCLAMANVLFPGEATNAIGAVGWFTFLFTSLVCVPAAVGIAILRHRLLDIDLVLNRTVVYGCLTATLAAAYLGGVLLLQVVLNPLPDTSELEVAGSTLAVAALFRPARARIQAVVDRRFYRRRYDAEQVLAGFGVRLRSELDLDLVGADLRSVVEQAIDPVSVSLWLKRQS